MNKTEAKAVLRLAFAALTREQQGNLRWHAEQKTRVLCGRFAMFFFRGGGG